MQVATSVEVTFGLRGIGGSIKETYVLDSVSDLQTWKANEKLHYILHQSPIYSEMTDKEADAHKERVKAAQAAARANPLKSRELV